MGQKEKSLMGCGKKKKMNKILNVHECDATKANASDAARLLYQIINKKIKAAEIISLSATLPVLRLK